MKRKFALIGSMVLAIVVLATVAIPVFAADDARVTPPVTQGDQLFNRTRILARILLIQDEAKVDALIAKAQDAGKITEEQAIKVKEFWTNHHKQFTRK
jgi:uncharacterized glyoxalase superfamily protein PhnB